MIHSAYNIKMGFTTLFAIIRKIFALKDTHISFEQLVLGVPVLLIEIFF